MELTTPVILKRPFIDAAGNKYSARGGYLYGEFPANIRDNPDFVVPESEIEVIEETIEKSVMDSTERIDALNRPEETKVLEVKPKTVKTTYKTKTVAPTTKPEEEPA